ncbi:10430_t:CDS:1, partial [Ambispora gerdemannii]
MWNLFETEYILDDSLASFVSYSSSNNSHKNVLKSKLNADFFDDGDNDIDKLEQYISEKPVNKEIDVLA